eukprot:451946-Prorocentrum_minimum.AAC.3
MEEAELRGARARSPPRRSKTPPPKEARSPLREALRTLPNGHEHAEAAAAEAAAAEAAAAEACDLGLRVDSEAYKLQQYVVRLVKNRWENGILSRVIRWLNS